MYTYIGKYTKYAKVNVSLFNIHTHTYTTHIIHIYLHNTTCAIHWLYCIKYLREIIKTNCFHFALCKTSFSVIAVCILHKYLTIEIMKGLIIIIYYTHTYISIILILRAWKIILWKFKLFNNLKLENKLVTIFKEVKSCSLMFIQLVCSICKLIDGYKLYFNCFSLQIIQSWHLDTKL